MKGDFVSQSRALLTHAQSEKPRTPRRYGVCSGCQTSRLVRRDGLVCRHESPWGDRGRCPGENATPIPIAVPSSGHDCGDVPILPTGRVLDRWDYLSLPMRSLLLTLRAYVRDVPAPYVGYRGAIAEQSVGRSLDWVLRMPIGQDPLERDLLVRGLLATVHGVSVVDWPVPMS